MLCPGDAQYLGYVFLYSMNLHKLNKFQASKICPLQYLLPIHEFLQKLHSTAIFSCYRVRCDILPRLCSTELMYLIVGYVAYINLHVFVYRLEGFYSLCLHVYTYRFSSLLFFRTILHGQGHGQLLKRLKYNRGKEISNVINMFQYLCVASKQQPRLETSWENFPQTPDE